MRALVQKKYGPLSDLRIVEWPKPAPADDAVLIRVRAVGLDPGIWHLMTGRPLMIRAMGFGFSGPRVPVAGWDAAGVVEAIGAKVTRFKPGDEIFGNCDATGTGTLADYACLPEARCAPKPANLTLEDASALAVSGCTALQCIRDHGHVGDDSKVLVIGAAGGVGHYAVQIAKTYGATVTGVCSTAKLDFVRGLGADDVIDYTRGPLSASERRWDVVIDTAGMRGVKELRSVLAPNGVLAIVGGEGGNAWTGGFIERALAAAIGSLGSRQKLVSVNAKVTESDLATLKKLVENGKLKPAIEQRYPLEQAVTALETLARGGARGKSIVVLG
ncbi:MAG: NAD(P)-dependent alcohol dehydrogenase [Myxococcota bacterium]|nr:NAD(P)-dependent alcohol dehydrogenase [Myxococcota bacterium]